jgi:hypothetical protein
MTKVKTYYFEDRGCSETVNMNHFDMDFLASLVEKARKKAIKDKKSKKYVDINVREKGLTCHYVDSVSGKNEMALLVAMQVWNAQQEGFRKMFLSKGLKRKEKAIYVIYSDKYIDSDLSFWDIYYNQRG